MHITFCDVCGAFATQSSRDLKEVGGDESGWALWEVVSDWRFGCVAHPPSMPIIERLDGKLYTPGAYMGMLVPIGAV